MDATAFAVASALGIIALAASGVLYARELERRKQLRAFEQSRLLHEERMAAIGAMAAGVLRDIVNPIAAIDGYARAMVDAQRRGEMPPPPAPECDPALIVSQTRRLAEITHEISELAAAPATQCQLVSVNDIVLQSLALLRYEPRLARAQLRTRLDPQLPALPAVAERLVLLVSELVRHALGAGATRIGLDTAAVPHGIELTVSGDGRAAPPDPALARAITAEQGGLIDVNWNPQSGTWIRVLLKELPLH